MKDPHSIEGEPFFEESPGDSSKSEHRRKRASGRSEPPPGLDMPVAPGETNEFSSIYDEPNMFSARDGQPITGEWRCGHCGYDLHGLKTGDRCPECGEIEIYYPPPADALSYGQWLRARSAIVHPWAGAAALAAVVLVTSPLAVFGAMTSAPIFGGVNPLMPVAMGPLADEIMKAGLLTWLVETRPYLIRSASHIVVTAALTGLAWAIVENLFVFRIFSTAPSSDVLLFRWTVCLVGHAGCAAVAGVGLARIWESAVGEGRVPRMVLAFPYLTGAIVLHMVYNALIYALDRGDLFL